MSNDAFSHHTLNPLQRYGIRCIHTVLQTELMARQIDMSAKSKAMPEQARCELRWAFIVAFLLAIPGCTPTFEHTTSGSPLDLHRQHIEALQPHFGTLLMQASERRAVTDVLRKMVAKEAERPWRQRKSGGIKYADLLTEYYETHAPLTISGVGEPNELSVTIGASLAGSGAHALDPKPYHIAEIERQLAEIQEPKLKPAWPQIKLTPDELEALVDWYRTIETDDDLADDADQFQITVAALIENDTAALPRVRALIAAHTERYGPIAESFANLELRLVDGLLRYARDMKHFNLKRMSWKDLKAGGGSKKIIYDRLRETLEEFATGEPKSALLKLEPPHPQYRLLVDALKQYREIQETVSWPNVRRTNLNPGAQGPMIQRLRERLEREAYLERDESMDRSVVDASLSAAVKTYQTTHQLQKTPVPSRSFWRSINIPLSVRIRQIEISLQRWRESHYAGEEDFLFVNIPGFQGELHLENTMKHRFRVVTGNTKRTCDPKTEKWIYPNQTPIQMGNMEYMIFNPHWYVPDRIVEEELLPEIEVNPNWLAENGYELVSMDDGKVRYRQVPGTENALGQVKFIFPNPHNTFLHDTPNRSYFNYPIRAFSHGCVRVHEPLELATLLLKADGHERAQDVAAIVASEKTKKLDLARDLPIFIEYYTVWVDDEKRTNFLADIYKLDKKIMQGESSHEKPCRPSNLASDTERNDNLASTTVETNDLGP
jgi:L,D-transpeptidase YcbB